ncbi:error-prone DNA polymerase [Thiorhodovibrio frisius]|uniref:Error-prone DNA polymerase n=1 Tax=Thiorhodovibrio frisius TaxID=631362 RepID=H8YZI7_9GAMM|nr:error-prone DNA polymerase [Thiorhodovibrio frisius]EIC22114.1 DNA-directed DNA polymerase III PolC [Thiorhodovibrio frisius]WPL24407.1 Error-prone DNA polymerase [Thiorhodovibrio frisius]
MSATTAKTCSDHPGLDYAELCCQSHFSFLSAASSPEELVVTASALGYRALALTDACSLAGCVRAHVAARSRGMALIIGSLLELVDGPQLVVLATNLAGYRELSTLIARGRRQAPKGRYRLARADLEPSLTHCLAIWLPDAASSSATLAAGHGAWLRQQFPGRAWLGIALHRQGDDRARLAELLALAEGSQLPAVAVGEVLMHAPERAPLLDALTAIRHNSPIARLGTRLAANRERHLRPRERLARLYPPELLRETLVIAERCQFSLAELRYEYPQEVVPAGLTPIAHLRTLTAAGAGRRWPDGAPEKVQRILAHELELIDALDYAPFFLTVFDIVEFARARGILCQGRGSAANSAVCYCLSITEVDPSRMELLFERFISRERNEPPDIDVDFEHQRREEVIQYIYAKYGRDRAALAAEVICYRPKSALRDLGKALGLPADSIDRLAGQRHWWDGQALDEAELRAHGLDPDSRPVRWLKRLLPELIGTPRHLSQHVGGFVISRGPLAELVPIENAAMPGRTVIQWDKDDIDALGLLKVDCLALGMLSAIRRALDLISDFRGRRLTMADVPPEDPAVYQMIGRAETTGVFQIESRAQMAMLPRIKPACFYDLVIQIAIVRPGPIQGDMVHPYLRRRAGLEPVSYPSEEVRSVLGRTLGVPIFQEQVIKIAMVAAGFDAGEADRLRRSMAAWKKRGGLGHIRQRLLDGMRARGYAPAFAEQLYRQILGFGEYGFPESHAASFALLVYVSAWLKCQEPAAFFAALLNSQPMGFYAPAQLVRAAKGQGVEVRPADVRHSDWDCTLEADARGAPALRLGLRLVKGLGRGGGERLIAARELGGYSSVAELASRARLDRRDLNALAAADCLRGLAADRHQAAWQVSGYQVPLPLFQQVEEAGSADPCPTLAAPSEGENIVADYASLGLSLRRHPLALLRPRLNQKRLLSAAEADQAINGLCIETAGLVINRQRPASANEVTFVTLEDETGFVNLIVWRQIAECYRQPLLNASLLRVHAQVQRQSGVTHLIARTLHDETTLLNTLVGRLQYQSRDFH